MKKILLISGIILLGLVGVKSYNAFQVPAKPDIRGVITSVSKSDSDTVWGHIMVEGAIEKDTAFDKASITVSKKTKIFRVDENKKKETIGFDELKTTQKAEVVFTGPVRESYPVQADALEIRVLE